MPSPPPLTIWSPALLRATAVTPLLWASITTCFSSSERSLALNPRMRIFPSFQPETTTLPSREIATALQVLLASTNLRSSLPLLRLHPDLTVLAGHNQLCYTEWENNIV